MRKPPDFKSRTESDFLQILPDNSDSGGRGFESRQPYQKNVNILM